MNKEKEIFEKFIEVREQNKQVSLTIEFAEKEKTSKQGMLMTK